MTNSKFFKALILIFCTIFIFGSALAQNEPVKAEDAASSADNAVVENDLQSGTHRVEDNGTFERTFSRQLEFMTIIVSVSGGILIAIAVGATYMFGRSLANTKSEIQSTIGTLVMKELSEEAKCGEDFKKLSESLASAKVERDTLKTAIDQLAQFEKNIDSIRDDPSYSYEEASRIDHRQGTKEGITPSDRKVALGHLRNVISGGCTGNVDPNTLFNASVVANRFDFDAEAVKLAVLSKHFKSTPTHDLLLADVQNTFGVDFTFDGKDFTRSTKNPDEIRSVARARALNEVLKCPREGSEIIYSRASNIAARERESGGLSQLIDAISSTVIVENRKELFEKIGISADVQVNHTAPLVSFAFAKLCDLHSQRGALDWKEKVLENMDQAIQALSRESRSSTWFESSVSLLKRVIEREGLEAQSEKMCEKHKFDLAAHTTKEEKIKMALLAQLRQKATV